MKSKLDRLNLNLLPREKAKLYGIETLSDNELLAIILSSGTRKKSVLQISYELIEKYNGLSNLLKQDFNELKTNEGIHDVKAIQLLSLNEILNRINLETENKIIKINSVSDAYNYFKKIIKFEKQENTAAIFLNSQNNIIFSKLYTIGDDNHSIIPIKFIIKDAITKLANKVIIAHNHPSNEIEPSFNDVNVYTSLKEALNFANIRLLDHLIIGKNKTYSIASNKQFDCE